MAKLAEEIKSAHRGLGKPSSIGGADKGRRIILTAHGLSGTSRCPGGVSDHACTLAPQALGVDRQAYHSGSVQGNHAHEILKNEQACTVLATAAHVGPAAG